MKRIHELNKQREEKSSLLMAECQLFFAFSKEQFSEGLKKVIPPDKIVSLGAGGYIPKRNVQKWIEGVKEITDWRKSVIEKEQLQEEEILYHLSNFECFYTGDYYPVLSETDYTEKQVRDVFLKYWSTYQEA